MTVEVVKVEETQLAEVVIVEDERKEVVEEKEKVVSEVKEVEDEDSEDKLVHKSSSYREESDFLADLKEFEKKALSEMKAKLEEAILGNTLFKKVEAKKKEDEKCKEEKKPEEVKEEEKKDEKETGRKEEVVNEEISLWGVPLLPSKGTEGIDVVLLKFLRAREFKVDESLEMLTKTLQWRKENDVDTIVDEEVGVDLSAAFYMCGVDREGHPVCYNIYGAFGNKELHKKAFGSEKSRKQFLRWRFQLMEMGVKKLDLRPGGVTSLLQISDLKDSPSPFKKEIRSAMNQAVELLQDNYPEFVARNIFINVPFWYYALNTILSPFLTQRSKSKLVVARPAKVTETLLKYIQAEEIPVQYGGFKRENDFEFPSEDGEVSELAIKSGSVQTIEIPAEKAGTTLLWDLTVLGWEVNYKEEFVPTDEGSYTIIVQKGKKMSPVEGPIRNTFKTNEPGKVVLTIENCSSKKKRVLYRLKTKKTTC